MLHMNLLRWRNWLDSLSRDIGQYPMIEISNSGHCFHCKMSCYARRHAEKNKQLIKTNKSWQKA